MNRKICVVQLLAAGVDSLFVKTQNTQVLKENISLESFLPATQQVLGSTVCRGARTLATLSPLMFKGFVIDLILSGSCQSRRRLFITGISRIRKPEPMLAVQVSLHPMNE